MRANSPHHAHHGETLESLTEASLQGAPKIQVHEGDGWNVQMNARVNHSPEDVYSLLTDPAADKVFRSIQACTQRKVLAENKSLGQRKLLVSHRSGARFLFINVTFDTTLYVWEDDRARSIRFENASEGFMKKFTGRWNVRSFTAHSLEEANCGHHHVSPARPRRSPSSPSTTTTTSPVTNSSQEGLSWFKAQAMLAQFGAAVQQRLVGAPSGVALVTLEQHIIPKAHPPPGVRGLVRGLVAHQVSNMMEDAQKELDRRKLALVDKALTSKAVGPSVGAVSSKVDQLTATNHGLPPVHAVAVGKGGQLAYAGAVGRVGCAAAACCTLQPPLFGDFLWKHVQSLAPLINIEIKV